MDVSDFEACTVTAEAAWPEGRETALVGQLGKRIRLIHELTQLTAAEEVTDYSAKRLGIDEFLRRDLVRIGIKQRHALADETLGAGEADAALVGKKFAHNVDAMLSGLAWAIDSFGNSGAQCPVVVDERIAHVGKGEAA
jgi:hypothetical protein